MTKVNGLEPFLATMVIMSKDGSPIVKTQWDGVNQTHHLARCFTCSTCLLNWCTVAISVLDLGSGHFVFPELVKCN